MVHKKPYFSRAGIRWFCLLISSIILLIPGVGRAQAPGLPDWSRWNVGVDLGVVADTKGTQIDISQVAGSEAGEKVLKATASLVEWGTVWTVANVDLTTTRALKFKAKVSAPALMEIGLTDHRKVRYVAKVRIVSEDWEEFVVPVSQFEKTKYPAPDAPVDAKLDLSKIERIQFSPWTTGTTTYWVGPVSRITGVFKARTGMPSIGEQKGLLRVQDFKLLDKRGYGPFTNTSATKIRLDVERDPREKDGKQGSIHYEMDEKGWCGVWLRCGDDWGGQDWRGAKALKVQINSRERLSFEFGFNDKNQNAYVAVSTIVPVTKGKGWETLVIPFGAFQLNPYYQPPEGKKGAAQDLSRIETFNIAPKTPGKQSFELGEVILVK